MKSDPKKSAWGPRSTRRTLLKAAGAGAASLAVPAARAQGPDILVRRERRLRVLGTHVTLQEAIREQAEADLGIQISFEPGGSARVLHQAATRPESFDLYEQWSNSINVLWHAGSIQQIDRGRIRYWDEVNDLTKTGRILPGAPVGAGDAPHKLLYVQRDGSLSQHETQHISFLPYAHNVDSIGYDADVIDEGVPYETESWGWLFDDAHRGKVALVNAPTIGLFDAALAAQATGRMTFEDIGALTREELDGLFRVLIELKRAGHFRGVWSSVPQSVEFMQAGEVSVESMFSPAVAALNGQGTRCIYAAPKEGYRAWHGVMCLSAATNGAVRDAAYEYMNWWLSGWPGAFIARQGYYISTPERSKPHLSDDEWNYWYGGRATRSVLHNTEGVPSVPAGAVRRGGSYTERFSHVAVWNTVLPAYEYSLQRWGEFLLA